MSKVQKIQKQQTPAVEMSPEMPAAESLGDISAEDRQAGATHARRIVVEANVSADQLRSGATIKIPGAVDIFRPSYDMDKLDEEQKESMEKLDFTKGIVTGMTLKSVYSNVGEPVSVGINLFQNRPQIVNNEGWLFTETSTDMGNIHASNVDGYVNLVNVLPYEKARPDTKIYSPENLLNNRFIEQYGGYTLDKLWDGIVPFKGKDYMYVEANHIILSIIQKNWELLGINAEAEVKRENQYVKVSKNVVNSVIKQLYEQVIMQIPYTSFDNLSARFQANNVPEGNYKVMCEFFVQYKYPAIQSGDKLEEA